MIKGAAGKIQSFTFFRHQVASIGEWAQNKKTIEVNSIFFYKFLGKCIFTFGCRDKETWRRKYCSIFFVYLFVWGFFGGFLWVLEWGWIGWLMVCLGLVWFSLFTWVFFNNWSTVTERKQKIMEPTPPHFLRTSKIQVTSAPLTARV